MSEQEYLIDYIIQDIVAFHVKETNLDIATAMAIIYNSTVFEKLQDLKTGLYLESSGYVYDLLQSELRNGKFIQEEI